MVTVLRMVSDTSEYKVAPHPKFFPTPPNPIFFLGGGQKIFGRRQKKFVRGVKIFLKANYFFGGGKTKRGGCSKNKSFGRGHNFFLLGGSGEKKIRR